jgi:hypothetical protein
MSANGRFVSFTDGFPGASWPHHLWLRESATADGDGVFDEPGDSTTTRIDTGDRWFGNDLRCRSDDHQRRWRWVAFTAFVAGDYGDHMYMHDRINGNHGPPGLAGVHRERAAMTRVAAYFSDTGEFVYYTSMPILDPDNTSPGYDVYLVNLLTGGHVNITPNHDNDPDPWLHQGEHEMHPAITPDGRYVMYSGQGGGSPGRLCLRPRHRTDRHGKPHG